VPEKVKARALSNYGKLPLSFEENRGQAAASAKYLSHGSDYSILLGSSGVSLNLPANGKNRGPSTVRMTFPGAQATPVVTAEGRQAAISSYFIGNDPSRWVTGAPNFARVNYHELYRGIDLAFYGNQGRLEYDFLVAPGADPGAIRLQFGGLKGMRLAATGDLILSTENGEVLQHKPIAYQDQDGARRTVDGHYRLQSGNRVAFEIAKYDRQKPLVIDPVLTFSTYLGSPGEDVFSISGAASLANYPAVAVDTQGNTYVAGFNGGSAGDFTGHPVTLGGNSSGGGTEVFVVKLNTLGTGLLYDVVFGGGFTDVAGGIAVDGSGNAYVTGNTNSTNFPVTVGAPQNVLNGQTNAFVTEVNAAGNGLVYSTYLGGSGNFYGNAIAVDHSGNAYVTGTAAFTGGTSFPLVNPLSSSPSNGFLTEVNAGGNGFAYSTYLSAGIGYGIAVDGSGNAYVAGSTGSKASPSPSQGYALKVDAGGTGIAYGPVLIGSAGLQTVGFAIAIDSSTDAYVTGMTNDQHFPEISSGAQSKYGGGLTDGFAIKLGPSGSLVYGTYIGGLGSNLLPERGSGIGVDQQNNAYISGTTECIGFPTLNSISGTRNGGPTALMRGTISGATSNWSNTNLTGSFDQVTALAFDPAGDLYAGASAVDASGGGIYKLPAGSGSWISANSGITTSTIDAIAVDPNSTSTIYAAGSGHLYQSTNAGSSWTQLSQQVGTSAVIAIARTTPTSTIYVGSSVGLIYSTNAGASWSNPAVGPGAGSVSSIIADPSNTRTAYAGTPTSVYQTVNGGANWAQVASGLPTGLGGAITSLAINATTHTIYAATPNGLYDTTSAGASWAQLVLGQIASTPLLVAVDAGNNVYVAFQGAGLATGTSGGTSSTDWSALTYNGLTQNPIVALATPPSGSGTAYAGIVSETTGFLVELNSSGALTSSTCIGGSDNNLAQSIAVTSGGSVMIAGVTASTNFPTTTSTIQKTNAGLYDAFALRIDNQTFADVPPSNAFYNFINLMYEDGITGGCSTNPLDYCPNSTTTRGEMAVFIITAMFGNSNFAYTTTPYFNDVPANNSFFKFIQKMKDLNITSGCGGGNYCLNDSVTRAEMAVFIIAARYGTIPFTYPTTPYFSDVPSSSSYFPFVQKMAQLGITGGCAVGLYCPDDALTRGQMAVFIVTGLLDQLLSPTTPIITEAVPNSANPGDIVTVTLTATGTNFDSTTQVAVPTGMTASNITILSPTSLSVQLAISPTAIPSLTATNGSFYTIAVTTGSSEADLPNGFTVQ
jgi:hypothetical protein